ncbi:MAG TPA: Hsp20/alpha crystallin family protein [Candidatus Acidoferrales bacterium]|nr:Hsp20/alpha crystallin family protein [Candidatus Acidoferrales bacterium]
MNAFANLARWDPFREMQRAQEQFNRLLGDKFLVRGDNGLSAWSPEVDIRETEEELVLEADLPGIEEKDLDIRVEGNMLTIRGERKFEKKESEESYLRVERSYGSFTRSFSLPQTVKTESIKASYHDGVLTIRLPKREEAKPKQVKVEVGSAK